MVKRPLCRGEKSGFIGFSTPSSNTCANLTDTPSSTICSFERIGAKLVRNLLNPKQTELNGKY
jgi:hypothetical protein